MMLMMMMMRMQKMEMDELYLISNGNRSIDYSLPFFV